MDWNVHLYAFDDLDMVQEAVATIPDGVPIHVCDGRYHDFEGDRNVTPGLAQFCADHPDAVYHMPPEDALPFGDPRLPDRYRSSVYAKAQWVNYQVLPGDEWTLKLDSDERLRAFDEAILDSLSPKNRYVPQITRRDGSPVHVARLYQPQYWTVWLDDCLLPRAEVSRDCVLAHLAYLYEHPDYRSLRFARRDRLEDVRVENVGVERPADYQRRRVDHLEAIGRDDRAAALRQRLE